ncbi:hypothetical protein [Corynebacterium sp. p3-SID1140]|nr:hypothetical protein [Corynebacterium sp. p3-SID1140]MCT1461903.1 hypothetical protein [Corynebacterium sp. p3-SID1140]
MRTFAEAIYRRQQIVLDLENALPFEVQIAHDIEVRPGRVSSLTRVRENELRAVKPVIFSGLDFSTPQAQERNRFLGSMFEQSEKRKPLPVGELMHLDAKKTGVPPVGIAEILERTPVDRS